MSVEIFLILLLYLVFFVVYLSILYFSEWKREQEGRGYDERQKIAIGKGYRDAFAFVMCGLYMLMQSGNYLVEALPVSYQALSLILFFLGLGVFIVSCTVRGALSPVKVNPWRTTIAYAVLTVACFILSQVFSATPERKWLMVFVGCECAVLTVITLIRIWWDKRQTED